MPFGLSNAPAVFQNLLNDVLCDFFHNFCFCLPRLYTHLLQDPRHTQDPRPTSPPKVAEKLPVYHTETIFRNKCFFYPLSASVPEICAALESNTTKIMTTPRLPFSKFSMT